MRLRQGDIVRSVHTNALTEPDSSTKYLIITHCCSLARKGPVELLSCRQLPVHEGIMTRGRNPRKLHFQINEKWHEVVAYQKILCPAEDVEKATKVYRANPDERRILQNWLALGYRRQAFNSATDAMVRKLQLSSIVKKCEKDLVGIWLDCIHSSEKADTTQYYDIYSVFFADSDFHCHTEMIEGRIVKVIEDGWDITPFVISDDDFSYREAMTFTYINFDYFSTENIIDR